MKQYLKLIIGFIVFFFSGEIYAAQTKYINLQGTAAFVKGEFKNIQVNAQGSLLLSPEVKEIFDTKNLLIQSSLKTDQGVYFSTAKDAGLFFYNSKTQETKKLYENSQSLSIPTFAVDGETLYFVESPSNTLYKLDLTKEDAAPDEIQKLEIANYIWQMGIEKDTLYIATGSKAALYKLPLKDLSSKPKLLLEVKEEKHFLTMLLKDGKAYLGAQGNGGVYKVDLKTGRPKTLYKTYEGEVSDIIVTDKDGIFITTSNREPKVVGTDFDYTDTLLAQQLEYQIIKSKLMDAKQLNEDGSFKEGQQGTAVKNSLYQIQDTKVDKLITLDGMSLNKMVLTQDGKLIIGTSSGRIFSYTLKNKDLSLLASLSNEDITGIVPIGDSYLTTTSNIGQVYLLSKEISKEGAFTSEVIDLGNNATLGKITLEEEFLNRGDIKIFVRGGQNENPDNNWSEWVGPFTMQDNKKPIDLKDLRYVQYKVEMNGKNGKTPELKRILTPYMPDNHVPTITLFSVFYDTAQEGSPKQSLQIRWSATDADKDQLLYRIYFKQRDDVTWSLLSENAGQDKIALDTKLLPDGVYYFKLEVSDELDNSPEKVGKATQVSPAVLINNTPPVITVTDIKSGKDDKIQIKGKIENNIALIAKAYYKIGVEDQWKFIISDTGIYDDKKIDFTILVDKKALKNFENILFFRAFDVNMNQVSYRIKLNKLGKQIH